VAANNNQMLRRLSKELFNMLLTRRFAEFVVMIAVAATTGCTYNKTVDQAIQKYEAHDYSAALQDFKTVDGNESDLTPRWETRYFVFRGLAHFRAYRKDGNATDHAAARRFLTKGLRQYERGERSFLTVQEERECHLALDALKE
jgi:hypothetical protein